MAGLVIKRRSGQAVHIGDQIVVIVGEMRCGQVRINIQAPPDMRVDRAEVRAEREREALEAEPAIGEVRVDSRGHVDATG